MARPPWASPEPASPARETSPAFRTPALRRFSARPVYSTARRCTTGGSSASAAIASRPSGPREFASRLRSDACRPAGDDNPARADRRALARAAAPYNETSWNDQVLKESAGLRVARATVHLRQTLMAGFTTLRDLGTEGAGVRRCRAEAGASSRASSRDRGCWSPRAPSSRPAATGRRATHSGGACRRAPRRPTTTTLVRVVRDQIGHGADWVKVYADYRWGPQRRGRADVLARRAHAHRRDGAQQRPAGGRARLDCRRDAARRDWPASRRSSTATAARPRSSG